MLVQYDYINWKPDSPLHFLNKFRSTIKFTCESGPTFDFASDGSFHRQSGRSKGPFGGIKTLIYFFSSLLRVILFDFYLERIISVFYFVKLFFFGRFC
jgi:hypothetical protein